MNNNFSKVVANKYGIDDMHDIEIGNKYHFTDHEEDIIEFTMLVKETNLISSAVDKMYENIETLRGRYDVLLEKKMLPRDRTEASTDVKFLVQKTDAEKDLLQKKLRRLAGENLKLKRLDFANEPVECRSRITSVINLARKFNDAVSLLDSVYGSHRGKVKSGLEKCLRRLNTEASDEDIQLSLRMGKMEEIVNQSKTSEFLDPQYRKELLDDFDYFQSENNDILKLATHMNELSALFYETQVLIHTQKEILNKFECEKENVEKCVEKNVDSSTQTSPQEERPSMMKWIAVILVLGLLLVFFMLLLMAMPTKNRSNDTNTSKVSESKKSGRADITSQRTTEVKGSKAGNPALEIMTSLAPRMDNKINHESRDVVNAEDIQKLLLSRGTLSSDQYIVRR